MDEGVCVPGPLTVDDIHPPYTALRSGNSGMIDFYGVIGLVLISASPTSSLPLHLVVTTSTLGIYYFFTWVSTKLIHIDLDDIQSNN